MIYVGFPSFFGLGLEDGHVPTFWLLLYVEIAGSFQKQGVLKMELFSQNGPQNRTPNLWKQPDMLRLYLRAPGMQKMLPLGPRVCRQGLPLSCLYFAGVV